MCAPVSHTPTPLSRGATGGGKGASAGEGRGTSARTSEEQVAEAAMSADGQLVSWAAAAWLIV